MVVFFFSSRRRHTRCALVTGVQTCALPIWSPPRSGVNTVWWSIRLRSRRRALARRRRGAAQYTFQQARRQALRPVTGYRVTADHDQPLVATHRSQCLVGNGIGAEPRSEEHTSELQSLMRISYAVFCLKK